MTVNEFSLLCLKFSNDFISLHEATGTFSLISPNCEKILGYKQHWLIGRNPYDFIHPDDKKIVEETGHLPLLNNEAETFLEYRFRTKNNGYKWFEVQGVSLKNEEGIVEGFLSVARDITELKQHVEQVLKKEIMLEQAGRMARIGAWELDLETKDVFWGKITYDIHEVEYGKMPKLDEAINFYAEESKPVITKAINDAIEKGIPYDLKLRFITARGNAIWVRSIGRPEIRRGKTVKLFGVFQDINKEVEGQTKLRELVDLLTRQKTQLQEYNQIVSHNLRSPISSLNSLIHFLENAKNEEEREIIINNLKDAAGELNTLLNDLVDAVKIINNNELVYEPLDIESVIKRTERMLEGNILELNAKIHLNLKKWKKINYPKLYFDSILLNLVSNALKYYSPERNPEIHITAAFEKGQKILTITDNGLGIDLKRYGDKVFKLHKTFHRERPGKGLGLFMTKNQVEVTGSEIQVESEPGRGTTFKIIFNPITNI